jgi:hypothetical protein
MKKGVYNMIAANEMNKFIPGRSEEYYPSEIANRLCSFTDCSCDEGSRIEYELKEAVYQLKAMAENKYNSDYWRVLWNALQNMTERLEYT